MGMREICECHLVSRTSHHRVMSLTSFQAPASLEAANPRVCEQVGQPQAAPIGRSSASSRSSARPLPRTTTTAKPDTYGRSRSVGPRRMGRAVSYDIYLAECLPSALSVAPPGLGSCPRRSGPLRKRDTPKPACRGRVRAPRVHHHHGYRSRRAAGPLGSSACPPDH
jgi:hypothetical protein